MSDICCTHTTKNNVFSINTTANCVSLANASGGRVVSHVQDLRNACSRTLIRNQKNYMFIQIAYSIEDSHSNGLEERT